MSREKAKLSYRWKAAVIQRWATSKGRLIRTEETGEPFRVPCCPVCTAQAVDRDGVPLTDRALNRKKHVCAACGSPLWQADSSGPKRYPLSEYVKRHMRGFFDLCVADEVHEFKARGSAQGHRRRGTRRRLREVPQPHGNPLGRLCLDHLPPSLPVLARNQDGVRTLRRGALDQAVRLPRRSPSASPTTNRRRMAGSAAGGVTARRSGRGRDSCHRRCST